MEIECRQKFHPSLPAQIPITNNSSELGTELSIKQLFVCVRPLSVGRSVGKYGESLCYVLQANS
jgi:hypothetical protein